MFPVTQIHVSPDVETVPPNEKLGSSEVPAILALVNTTASKPNDRISLVIPTGTARQLCQDLMVVLEQIEKHRPD